MPAFSFQELTMKIAVYTCGDIMFTGERSPSDAHVTSVGSWEELLALMTDSRPPYMRYPVGKSQDSEEMRAWHEHVAADRSTVGPQRAVLAALASGNFTVGAVSWAGAQGEKDHGYYAVIED